MRVSAAILLLLCACSKPAPEPSASGASVPVEKMNVLVVLLDAFAADHAGFLGYDRPTTPRLDEIAAESYVFEQCYAQSTGTSLSTFSFFTSRYPTFAQNPQLGADQPVFLPTSLPTWATWLAPAFPRRLGVSCNPFVCVQFGYDVGFTSFYEHYERAEYGPEAKTKLARHPGRRMLEWLSEGNGERFFAYLHYLEPHKPYDPPKDWIQKFTKGPVREELGHDVQAGLPPRRLSDDDKQTIVDLYDANLAYVDDYVGALVDSLKGRGQWEKTIFVLMSDHGEAFYQRGQAGHSGIPFLEVSRVPFFVRVPGVSTSAPKRIATPIELTDLLPSLMDLAGLEHAPGDFAGMSWRGLLEEDAAADARFRERGTHTRSNRSHLVSYAIRQGGYSWIQLTRPRKQYLYDATNDPLEMRDLWGKTPESKEISAQFAQRFETWIAESKERLDAARLEDKALFNPQVLETLRTLGYVD